MLPDTAGHLSLAKYGAANLPKPVFPAGEQHPQQEKGHRNRLPSKSSTRG